MQRVGRERPVQEARALRQARDGPAWSLGGSLQGALEEALEEGHLELEQPGAQQRGRPPLRKAAPGPTLRSRSPARIPRSLLRRFSAFDELRMTDRRRCRRMRY